MGKYWLLSATLFVLVDFGFRLRTRFHRRGQLLYIAINSVWDAPGEHTHSSARGLCGRCAVNPIVLWLRNIINLHHNDNNNRVNYESGISPIGLFLTHTRTNSHNNNNVLHTHTHTIHQERIIYYTCICNIQAMRIHVQCVTVGWNCPAVHIAAENNGRRWVFILYACMYINIFFSFFLLFWRIALTSDDIV